jgi:hypothetical protein
MACRVREQQGEGVSQQVSHSNSSSSRTKASPLTGAWLHSSCLVLLLDRLLALVLLLVLLLLALG